MEQWLQWLNRPAHLVAPALLGWQLVRKWEDKIYRGTIVETEAYEAHDPACHGYQRETDRNRAIFGSPGSVYVYLIYGIHHCVNIVTDRTGVCSAVLLRALHLATLPPWCSAQEKPDRVAAGPGKLCKALKIDRTLNGINLIEDKELWLEPPGQELSFPIVQTTRIGITKGVDIPWRWYWENHPAVSKLKKKRVTIPLDSDPTYSCKGTYGPL